MQPRDDLCDTCRQHRAVARFTDVSGPAPLERRMCIECYSLHPISVVQLIDIENQILAFGKCERCEARAVAVIGAPGPSRHVFCEGCQEAWLNRK